MARMFRIVAGGRRRAIKAIRAEVVAEFAEQLATAGSIWQRFRIQRAIRIEVKRRLLKQAPRGALYARR
jgi:hypothetical protein